MSLKGQVSADKICLTPAEMDYFLKQDLSQKSLCTDTAEYRKQIVSKNIQIALHKSIEQDLGNQVKIQTQLAGNYKQTAQDNYNKYSKAQDKAKFRGKVLIGSLSLNLALIATGFVLLKFK